MQSRSTYRWDGTKIDLDVVRQNEEQLDRLLRKARARNAAAQRVEHSSFEEWPSAGNDVVWRPHLAEGAKTRHDRGRPRLPHSGAAPRWAWLTRSLVWLLLVMMAGVACLPFGADLVRIAAAVL